MKLNDIEIDDTKNIYCSFSLSTVHYRRIVQIPFPVPDCPEAAVWSSRNTSPRSRPTAPGSSKPGPSSGPPSSPTTPSQIEKENFDFDFFFKICLSVFLFRLKKQKHKQTQKDFSFFPSVSDELFQVFFFLLVKIFFVSVKNCVIHCE